MKPCFDVNRIPMRVDYNDRNQVKGSQNGQGLAYKAGEGKIFASVLQTVFNRSCNTER